ncbi:MAG TPA: GNAT family N-acetyltransferase [Candidatus Atribacteria bacterium]|nr:GNAT family N-acetyltransferase [Candidatus Atribacteria bacterium]
MDVTSIKIRNYQIKDREAIQKISLENIVLGEHRDSIFDDEILADLLTKYFTDYEPLSCFVAVKVNQVIGYIIGAQDIRKMRRLMKHKIVPGLICKALGRRQLLRRNSLILLKNIISSYLKGEFISPDFSQEYPATLHINIRAEYRRQNIGSLLIDHFLDFLQKENVRGVHFGVVSESAKDFFIKLNFNILFSGKYSFLRFLLGKTIPHYIMGKHI